MAATHRGSRATLAMAGACLALVAIVGTATAAGPPQPVEIESTMWVGDPPNTGDFSTAGSDLICDWGTIVDTRYVWGGMTPHGQQLQVDKTFDCGDGEIYVRMQISGVFADETFTWVVLGGTDRYAGLHGRGDGWTEGFEGYVINHYSGFLVG